MNTITLDNNRLYVIKAADERYVLNLGMFRFYTPDYAKASVFIEKGIAPTCNEDEEIIYIDKAYCVKDTMDGFYYQWQDVTFYPMMRFCSLKSNRLQLFTSEEAASYMHDKLQEQAKKKLEEYPTLEGFIKSIEEIMEDEPISDSTRNSFASVYQRYSGGYEIAMIA